MPNGLHPFHDGPPDELMIWWDPKGKEWRIWFPLGDGPPMFLDGEFNPFTEPLFVYKKKSVAENKSPEWASQDHPQAQFACALMGIEGWVANFEEGVELSPKSIENMRLLVDRLKELGNLMPNEW